VSLVEAPLRLRRILDPQSGRGLLISFTSAMEVGVIRGMGDLPGIVAGIAQAGRITGAIVHSGVVESLFDRHPDLPCGVIVDLFGGTWMTTQPERREQICSLEHAVRVGADAVLVGVGLGSSDESRQLRMCGQIAWECKGWGMPLVVRIDTTDSGAARQFSSTLSGHGARLAYEIGADVAIVNYPGDAAAFAEGLKAIDIPVLIGGAPNLATDAALLETVGQAMRGGASGASLSAPMFWDDGPSKTLAALSDAVFGKQP